MSAARKHLERMRSLGVAAAQFLRQGPGRPKKVYSATEDGKELLPRRYDSVLIALMSKMVEERGADYVEGVMSKIARDIAGAVSSGSRGRKRVDRLLERLNEMGFEASAKRDDGHYTFTSRNCPVLKVATAHREVVCRGLHEGIIRWATQGEVRRGKWIVDGDSVCTHLVRMGP